MRSFYNRAVDVDAESFKVPTILLYPQGSDTPSQWGFQAETTQDQDGVEAHTREWFKVWLDDDLAVEARRSSVNPLKIPSLVDVEKWYVIRDCTSVIGSLCS